jgi:hypothetical protein
VSSAVFAKTSITQVVRLSGSLELFIFAIQFLSVCIDACQKAVSLKVHLFFLESHHFVDSQAHHFSQLVVPFTSNFSIKFFKEE